RKRLGPLALDVGQNAFYLNEEPLALSRREYAALKTLFERTGRAVAKEYLHAQVFAEEDVLPDAVEGVVFRLRKRLDGTSLLISARVIAERLRLDDTRLRVDVPYGALALFENDIGARFFYRVTGLDGEFVAGDRELPTLPEGLPRSDAHAALVRFYDGVYR